MIKKILFPILLVLGVVVGGVAADFLRNKSAGGGDAHAEEAAGHGAKAKDSHGKKAKDSHGKKAKGGHGKKADKGGHGKKADKGGHGKKKKKKGGHGEEAEDAGASSALMYLKFKRQFVVPVVKSGKIESLVLLNLNLELSPSAPDDAHMMEPKLRDALMRSLLGLAHEGVFTGDLTNPDTYDHLQESLLEATESVLADGVKSVLILDLTRQRQS